MRTEVGLKTQTWMQWSRGRHRMRREQKMVLEGATCQTQQRKGIKTPKKIQNHLLQMVTAARKLEDIAPWKKSYDQPRQCTKKQRHHFANKGSNSQSYGFSSHHVWMWELNHKEGWAPNNWCFWTVVLEKTLESPSYSKEIKQVNPKGSQPWRLIGRTDAEAVGAILWPPDGKSQLIGKTLMLWKIKGRRRRGWQRIRWLDGIISSMDMSLSKPLETVKDRGTWHAAVHRVTKSQIQLSN